ncbi:MAG: uracil phosphoribosyltransferase [Proteobacteria bacterium]|nr:uracil phosphoribosyltransferase [Pseudomonadota bacterium]
MKKHPDFGSLYVADHPLVLHKLSMMRDEGCQKAQFGAFLKEIALLMGYDVLHNLPMTKRTITTPLTKMDAPVLAGEEPVIVPILRAGMGMAEGLQELMPAARVGHIGLYRDEKTHEPVEYLVRLPDPKGKMFILVDPMLATGHSARYAMDVMVKRGVDPDKMRFMALVAAPEGVKVVQASYPKVPIFVAALDEKLNDKAYIVPGLGDAGDRLFGTTG